MKYLLLVIACCLAGPAWADDVWYKCTDAKGAVSIQGAPCPTGSKQIWKRDTTAPAPAPGAPASVTAPTPPSAPRTPPPVPAPPAAVPAPPAEAAPPTEAAPPALDPCDRAKDVAAQLRDMPWLELSHDQEQRLLGWVVEQCRR